MEEEIIEHVADGKGCGEDPGMDHSYTFPLDQSQDLFSDPGMLDLSLQDKFLTYAAEFSTSQPGTEISTGIYDVPVDLDKKSNHHTGPIPTDYIEDKRARQKSFSKRVQTFLNQGKLLYTMCGARVTIEVVSESGMVKSLYLPEKKLRTIKVQVGSPTEGLQVKSTETRSSSKSTHTPKKTKQRLVQSKTTNHVIQDLPGKKQITQRTFKERVNNKCSYCNIIFKSKKDKAFQKEKKIQATWVGCDEDGCGFWAHAFCADLKIPSAKKVRTLVFFCPEHRK